MLLNIEFGSSVDGVLETLSFLVGELVKKLNASFSTNAPVGVIGSIMKIVSQIRNLNKWCRLFIWSLLQLREPWIKIKKKPTNNFVPNNSAYAP